MEKRKGKLVFDELPKLLKGFGFENEIPIIEGSYDKQIDVREQDVDPAIIKKCRDYAKNRDGSIRYSDEKPMGFSDKAAQANGGRIVWND